MRTLHYWADIELDYPVRYSDVIVRDDYGVGEMMWRRERKVLRPRPGSRPCLLDDRREHVLNDASYYVPRVSISRAHSVQNKACWLSSKG